MEEEIKKEIIGKAGFPLYVDYWEKYFSKMTGEQIKEVLDIIFNFNKTYEIKTTNDLAVDIVVITIIDNIKRDAGKRLKQSKASRENGKNGGRPKKESKTEAKAKQTRSKSEANKNVNHNPNLNLKSKSELELKKYNVYDKLSDGLKFVLEAKLQRTIKNNNWSEEIRKLIENDLKPRANAIEDVKRAIQAIADNYGKEYFVVVQSAKALREKFTKIESYLERNQEKPKLQDSLMNLWEKYDNE